MQERKHVKVSIRGKVQGVWFRASTRDQAQKLGVAGFVRNEEDGSVYAELEGAPPVIDAMLNWCREGPPHARVDGVEVEEGAVQDFSGFEIHR